MNAIRGERSIFVSLVLSLVVLGFFLAVLNKAVFYLDREHAYDSAQKTEGFINEELGSLLHHTRELASSDSTAFYLRERGRSELLAYTLLETEARGLESILVTDEHGLVVSRTGNPLAWGDFVFESTAWGRRIRLEGETSSVEKGSATPLALVAGSSVEVDGKRIGAVVTGYRLTDEYARDFREKWLPAISEVAFIGKDLGLVGSSFDSNETKAVLEALVATLLPVDTAEELEMYSGVRIDLGDTTYRVSALPLVSQDGFLGHVIVFDSVSQVVYPMLIAALLVMLFFFLELRLPGHKGRGKAHFQSLAFWGFGLFLFSSFITYWMLESAVVPIKPLSDTIYNSTMDMVPEAVVFGEGYEQRIGARVITGGETINAAEVEILYDPEQVEINEILVDKSICSPDLFLEREIRPEEGLVKVSCIIHNGFTGQGLIAEVIARPLKPGTFSLKYGDGTKILAHDGLGTDVLRAKTDGSYRSISFDSFLGQGVPFVLHSPTHSNEERWYSSRLVRFRWSDDGTGIYSYSLNPESEEGSSVVTQEIEPDKDSIEFETERDGVYHFRLNTGSSAYEHKLKIDSTPPESPLILASETEISVGDIVRFELSSLDNESGLQNTFYFRIDGGIFLPVRDKLSVPFYGIGKHTVTVKSFDMANNSSESSVVITVRR